MLDAKTGKTLSHDAIPLKCDDRTLLSNMVRTGMMSTEFDLTPGTKNPMNGVLPIPAAKNSLLFDQKRRKWAGRGGDVTPRRGLAGTDARGFPSSVPFR